MSEPLLRYWRSSDHWPYIRRAEPFVLGDYGRHIAANYEDALMRHECARRDFPELNHTGFAPEKPTAFSSNLILEIERVVAKEMQRTI